MMREDFDQLIETPFLNSNDSWKLNFSHHLADPRGTTPFDLAKILQTLYRAQNGLMAYRITVLAARIVTDLAVLVQDQGGGVGGLR
jgi:hypothetical protein